METKKGDHPAARSGCLRAGPGTRQYSFRAATHGVILFGDPGVKVFRSCLFRLLAVPLSLVLLLAGYEAVQVYRAQLHTPAALASVAERPLKLAALTPVRRLMLLKVADPGFYRHHGVDVTTPGSGWTTITQSLAKDLYFPGGFKPGFETVEQSLIAWWVLDRAVSKDEQLEIYFNYASLGQDGRRPIRGFDDAARTIYRKPFDQLDDREYLSLVAMLNAPSDYDPRERPVASRKRVDRIIALVTGRCRPTGVFDVQYPRCELP